MRREIAATGLSPIRTVIAKLYIIEQELLLNPDHGCSTRPVAQDN